MSEFPSPPLVAEIQGLILKTFDVSKQEAHHHALGLAASAEGKGGTESAARLDWSYRVKKDLGEKLRWRSEADRKSFRSDQEQSHRAYDAYIQNKRRG